MYKSIAVFCGSNSGSDPIYEQHAKDLGALLAENYITLIYGGGNTGLMGAVANAALAHNGKVIGVIPEILTNIERQHKGLTELQVVADMHARKKIMYDLSEAAIILPGGNGTLDEMFEMITWNALTIHEKKIILLNTAGFYNALISHINTMQVKGFLHTDLRDTFQICDTPDAVISLMALDKN